MSYISAYPMSYTGVGRLQLGNIVRLFRSKNALSEATAVSMSKLDWMEIGVSGDPTNTRFDSFYKYVIKKTSDEKYWFDIDGFDKFNKEQTNSVRLVLIFVAIVFFVCALFGLVYSLAIGIAYNLIISIVFIIISVLCFFGSFKIKISDFTY